MRGLILALRRLFRRLDFDAYRKQGGRWAKTNWRRRRYDRGSGKLAILALLLAEVK